MHPYHYVRALIFSMVVIFVGLFVMAAQAAEAPKGNIDAIIAVLQAAKAKGLSEVVVVTADEGEGPLRRKVHEIDACGVAPAATGVVTILILNGREI